MDEIVTGLRYAIGGVSELYAIQPDLICLGKALGNGLPISVLAGRQEYLNWFNRIDPVFCSSTFWGESIGLAAAQSVLEQWDKDKVDYLWQIGNRLIVGLIKSAWNVIGDPAEPVLRGRREFVPYFPPEP